jgi:hypothetical protein
VSLLALLVTPQKDKIVLNATPHAKLALQKMSALAQVAHHHTNYGMDNAYLLAQLELSLPHKEPVLLALLKNAQNAQLELHALNAYQDLFYKTTNVFLLLAAKDSFNKMVLKTAFLAKLKTARNALPLTQNLAPNVLLLTSYLTTTNASLQTALLDSSRFPLLNHALHVLLNATNAMTLPNVLSAKRTTSSSMADVNQTVPVDMLNQTDNVYPVTLRVALLALLMERLAYLVSSLWCSMTTNVSLNALKANGHSSESALTVQLDVLNAVMELDAISAKTDLKLLLMENVLILALTILSLRMVNV